MQALLGEHGFLTGVAGHASAGNLHFMLTPELAVAADRERYESFMGKLVDLIVDKYDGSLKAEHGTGLNMAPYLEREWGPKATEMMWRIKALADPDGVLAPGVILNRDPGVHLRNLQSTPADRGGGHRLRRVRDVRAGLPLPQHDHHAAPADPAAPRDGAPARGLAGARGAARRVRARRDPDLRGRRQLRARLPGGDRHRQADQGRSAPRQRTDRAGADRAMRAARNWARVETAARARPAGGQRRARVAGDGTVAGAASALRRLGGAELVPRWPADMPPAAPAAAARDRARRSRRRLHAGLHQPDLRQRAGTAARPTLPEALVDVSARAGAPRLDPADDVAGNCCATPWSSKGYRPRAAS